MVRTIGQGLDESEIEYRLFDQNNNTSYAKVLLLSAEQISRHRFDETLPGARKFEIMVLEDDNISCGVVIREDYYEDRVGALALAGLAVAYFLGCLLDEDSRRQSGFACGSALLGIFLLGLQAFYDLIATQDEFLGMAIKREQASGLGAGLYGTHAVLLSPSSSNGGMRLTYHVRTQ